MWISSQNVAILEIDCIDPLNWDPKLVSQLSRAIGPFELICRIANTIKIQRWKLRSASAKQQRESSAVEQPHSSCFLIIVLPHVAGQKLESTTLRPWNSQLSMRQFQKENDSNCYCKHYHLVVKQCFFLLLTNKIVRNCRQCLTGRNGMGLFETTCRAILLQPAGIVVPISGTGALQKAWQGISRHQKKRSPFTCQQPEAPTPTASLPRCLMFWLIIIKCDSPWWTELLDEWSSWWTLS